jgi:drug/metabolite transporter (DMT)-like permease
MSAWLVYALVTAVLWGVWGALVGLPSERGVPETLNYAVWALTMIVPAAFILKKGGQPVLRDRRSVMLGLAIGILGAGGQLVLFHAVRVGPPYLIFPIISLSPAITIAMSLALLKERTGVMGAFGIALALVALPLFDYRPDEGSVGYGLWFVLALVVLLAWGVQAYVIKLANLTMDAASIFFYMMLSGLLLVPVALAMTDFSQPINYGLDGPGLAAAIQILNSIGALTLVFAFRHGKAIIVSPLVNAGAPLLTAVLSMILVGVVPGPAKLAGIVIALLAALLLALQPESPAIVPAGATAGTRAPGGAR